MRYFYSKTTGGFYIDAIHDSVPEDSVEITEQEYQQLFEDQTVGKLIVPDSNGYPIAVTVSPTLEDLKAIERGWRNSELSYADIELNKVQDSDPKAKGTVSDWRNYRKELRAYPDTLDFPQGIRPISP